MSTETQVNPVATCDNCGEPCSGFTEDATLIAMTARGEHMFRWGIDCKCGKRRSSKNAALTRAREEGK